MADENQLRDLINQINRENEKKKRLSPEEELLREFEESRKDNSLPYENVPYPKGGRKKTPYMQKMPYRRDSDGGPYIKKL